MVSMEVVAGTLRAGDPREQQPGDLRRVLGDFARVFVVPCSTHNSASRTLPAKCSVGPDWLRAASDGCFNLVRHLSNGPKSEKGRTHGI